MSAICGAYLADGHIGSASITTVRTARSVDGLLRISNDRDHSYGEKTHFPTDYFVVRRTPEKKICIDPNSRSFRNQASIEDNRRPKTSRSKVLSTRHERCESSLTLLTKRFVDLLHTSPVGMVEITRACELLKVQKRRIYDITNVLEGIGLVNKKLKNVVQWKDCNIAARISVKQNINRLRAEEEELDSLIEQCESMSTLLEVSADRSDAYVVSREIGSLPSFADSTVIALSRSESAILSRDIHVENQRLLVKSGREKIEAFVCPTSSCESWSQSLYLQRPLSQHNHSLYEVSYNENRSQLQSNNLTSTILLERMENEMAEGCGDDDGMPSHEESSDSSTCCTTDYLLWSPSRTLSTSWDSALSSSILTVDDLDVAPICKDPDLLMVAHNASPTELLSASACPSDESSDFGLPDTFLDEILSSSSSFAVDESADNLSCLFSLTNV